MKHAAAKTAYMAAGFAAVNTKRSPQRLRESLTYVTHQRRESSLRPLGNPSGLFRFPDTKPVIHNNTTKKENHHDHDP